MGRFTTLPGNFLGEHGGIELFTIGQRRGLPGGSPQPRYVVDLDPATNRVIVGDVDDLVTEEFEIDQANWHPVTGSRYDELECTAKNRVQPSRDPRYLNAIRRRARSSAAPARSAKGRDARPSSGVL